MQLYALSVAKIDLGISEFKASTKWLKGLKGEIAYVFER